MQQPFIRFINNSWPALWDINESDEDDRGTRKFLQVKNSIMAN